MGARQTDDGIRSADGINTVIFNDSNDDDCVDVVLTSVQLQEQVIPAEQLTNKWKLVRNTC